MHGGDIYDFAINNNTTISGILDFSANMNDFIRVKNLTLKREYIENYPENNLSKYKKILACDEFNSDNIAIVPGLTPFIHSFMGSIKGNVIIVSPVFTEYMKSKTNGKKILIPFNILNRNPEILKNYDFETLFLVYPDSPTGQIMNSNSLLSILEISMKKNSTVFIDESFIWFVNNRKINERDLIEKYHNIIIGRSMTKVLSIPGLRLAYIVSNPDRISIIENNLEPWRINEAALLYISSHVEDLSHIAKKTEVERKYLIKSLANKGFNIIGNPQANYITFKLPKNIDGYKLKAYLAGRNIMVRILDDYSEFGSNYIRVNVKRRIKNRILINALYYYGDTHD